MTRESEQEAEWIADGEAGVYISDGDGEDPIVVAYNEGGHSSTSVSVRTILKWVKERRPDLLT